MAKMTSLEEYVNVVAKYFVPIAVFCYSIPFFHYTLQYARGGSVDIIDYMSTSYAVSYFDHGFIRRGLIGTIVQLLPPVNLQVFVFASNTLCFGALLMIVRHAYGSIGSEPSGKVLKALFAISPFTSFHFGFDVGRFDILNCILVIASIVAVLLHRRLLVLILSLVALLVHEAVFLYGVPLILALMLENRGSDMQSSRMPQFSYYFIGAYAALCLALAYMIYKFGNSEMIAASTVGTGQEQWARPLVQYRELNVMEWVILGYVLTAIYGWLFVFYKQNKAQVDLIFLATYAPLSLFLLGWDKARWCALIFATVLFVISYKVICYKWVVGVRSLVYGMAVFLLPMGPIGISFFFPLIKFMWNAWTELN